MGFKWKQLRDSKKIPFLHFIFRPFLSDPQSQRLQNSDALPGPGCCNFGSNESSLSLSTKMGHFIMIFNTPSALAAGFPLK